MTTYLDHFKLNEAPFRLTPDPDFLYLSDKHAKAKSYMGSTIWFDDGFVIITGEVGSGKTTLLQSFIGELDDDTVCAVVSQTQLTPTEFLQATLHEFGFNPFGKEKVELLSMMTDFLIDAYANGKKVVLIVDEAQNLTWQVLEEIRLLSGVESHKEKVLRIILCGQPELKQTLETQQLKQLMQRVRCQFHLAPLSEKETQEYVLHRLKVAGNTNSDLLQADAHPEIFTYSGGVPRLINTLCDTAFLCAFAEDKQLVSRDDVLSAVEELGWQEKRSAVDETSQNPYLSRLSNNPVETDSLIRIDVRENGKIINEHYFGAGTISIGRSPRNDIRIPSRYVSLHHAEIVCTEKECIIRDLDSTNGMYVRGDRIKEYNLKHRDVITMDTYDLVFTDLKADSGSVWVNKNKDEDSSLQETLAS